MNAAALLYDFYFWAALVLFLLSAAGIFWILKSIQSGEEDEAAAGATAESLAQQIGRIEGSISKIEKKLADQNPDQMNEMAGQMKIIIQMIKTIGGAEAGGADSALQQKVDKIYQILSTLSRTETK